MTEKAKFHRRVATTPSHRRQLTSAVTHDQARVFENLNLKYMPVLFNLELYNLACGGLYRTTGIGDRECEWILIGRFG